MRGVNGQGETRDAIGLGVALLLLLACASFLPALDGGYVWDDDRHVTGNVALRSADGLRRIWFEPGATQQYYPLTFTSFWLEYQAFGASPFPQHLANVLLHVLNAILLWRVLSRLSVPGALVAAALFAVHPVHVESVAWISERKNLLSAAFYLAAALSYLRFARIGAGEGAAPTGWRHYAAAAALFLAALLSKTTACTLPAALLLAIWWKRGRLTSRDVVPALPLLAAGLGMACWTAWMEKVHIGIGRIDLSLSFLERVLIAGRALWFYLGKLFFPAELTFIYPRFVIDAADPLQVAAPAAALLLVVVLFLLRRRLGTGPLVAALFFGGTLLPALGFVDFFPMIYSFVADHFQYLASIGPLALCGALLARTRAGLVAAIALLAVLPALTWRQCGIYGSAEILWRDTLQKNPSALMASVNLADLLRREGRLAESLEALRHADDVDPALVHPVVRAIACYSAGQSLAFSGEYDAAIARFHEARAICPEYHEPLFGLGWVHALKGERAAALGCLATLLRDFPNHEPARTWYRKLLAEEEQDR